jgi:hypothetical protein
LSFLLLELQTFSFDNDLMTKLLNNLITKWVLLAI